MDKVKILIVEDVLSKADLICNSLIWGSSSPGAREIAALIDDLVTIIKQRKG